MVNENWHTLLSQVTERLRALVAASGSPSHGRPDDTLAEVLRDLDFVNTRYDEEQEEVILEAKRRMADREELHNANRLVTVGTLTVGMAHELGTPLGVVLARAPVKSD